MKSELTPNIRIAFARKWDLEETMAFEEVYHSSLRLSLREKIKKLGEAECVWLYDATTMELIGETYGLTVRGALDRNEEGFVDIQPFLRRRAMYIFSTTILPKFQEKGFGTILKAFFLGVVSQIGFLLVLGHARSGVSVHLNEAFGAQIGKAHPDWCGTGETYYFYTLSLMANRKLQERSAPVCHPRHLEGF